DCPDQSICRAGACVPGCSANHANCGDAGSCDLDGGTCHGCRSDKECTDAKKPFCDPVSGRCGGCSTREDACTGGQYCAPNNGDPQCAPGCKVDVDCQFGDGGNGSSACCNHVCIDLGSSLANCGACGAACNKSACCGGTCIDTKADVTNC